MKKTAIAAAILMAASGAAQANHQWDMTGGSFDFYDASGALSPQYPDGFSHTNVNGSFDLAAQSGSFSTTTPFSGALWTTDFTGMYFGPTDGSTSVNRFDWDVKIYEDTVTLERFTCNASGSQTACGEFETVNPSYYTLISSVNTLTDTNRDGSLNTATGYEFSLGAGQLAAGVFFNWSGNNGIPVLAVMQVTGQGFDAAGNLWMDIVSTDADNDGVPGTAMQTAPFPGQTPAFGGRLICRTATDCSTPPAVPVPAAVWLFGSGLLGLAGVARRRKAA